MKNSKKYLRFVFALLLMSLSFFILTGCKSENSKEIDNKTIKSETDSETGTKDNTKNKTEEEKTTDREETTKSKEEEHSENVEEIIANIIEKQKNAILKKDRYGYLNTINFRDKLLQDDKNMWVYCLTQGDIKDFNLELVDITSEEENKVVASIHLKYTVDENSYDLTYPVKFEKINDKWYHSGPDYREMNNGNIRLLYFEEDEKYAEMIMEAAVESYKTVLDNFNLEDGQKIVIKFYNNTDWLRQFVYPTYKRYFLAWSAGGGNLSLTYNEHAKNDEELKKAFKNTLTHEITHEISFAIAKYKSFPQWFFEGLAEYYSGPPFSRTKYDNLRMWTIEELDSDKFRKLTDKAEVRSFYVTSGKIVGYLIDKYGQEKIIELLEAIGESSLPNEKWKERFIEAFEKTYNIKYDEFKKEWARFIENQQ